MGYTESEKYPLPQDLSRKIAAASSMLSNIPPAQPAIIPWSAITLPSSFTFEASFRSDLGNFAFASASTFASISLAFARNS